MESGTEVKGKKKDSRKYDEGISLLFVFGSLLQIRVQNSLSVYRFLPVAGLLFSLLTVANRRATTKLF